MLLENNTNRFIDLKSLSEILLLTDTRSTEKWCNDKNIDISVLGNKKVVYRFLVEMELDKKLILQLKQKHPNKWEELYRCYQDNDKIAFIRLMYGKTIDSIELIEDSFKTESLEDKFKPQSIYAQKLLG